MTFPKKSYTSGMNLAYEDFLKKLEDGDMIALAEAHHLSQMWSIPMKELPFDQYFVGLCECLNCKQKTLQAWPRLEERGGKMICSRCHKPAVFPKNRTKRTKK